MTKSNNKSKDCDHPTIIFSPETGAVCQTCGMKLEKVDFCRHDGTCTVIPDEYFQQVRTESDGPIITDGYLKAICRKCGAIVNMGMPKP